MAITTSERGNHKELDSVTTELISEADAELERKDEKIELKRAPK